MMKNWEVVVMILLGIVIVGSLVTAFIHGTLWSDYVGGLRWCIISLCFVAVGKLFIVVRKP